jgi:uncharacterized membrane protein YfhO
MRRKLKGWKLFLIYTIIFAGIALMIQSIFEDNGCSYIWSPDGEFQYFPIMVYTRSYIVNIVKTLLHTGRLVLPTWDFSIGQGNNIFSVFQFNPFFLLALFARSKDLETVYGVIALIQWYCAGLSFMIFCRRIGKTETVPVVAGTLVYTFSGYAVFCGTKHIYFVVFLLVYLPLILTGVERYLQEKKWGFFVLMITLSLIGGYYYAFMNSLLMAVYIVFRQLAVNGRNIRKSLIETARMIGLYFLAFAMSMVVFLPKIINYFICSRSGTYTEQLQLFYTKEVYEALIACYGTINMDIGWSQVSIAGIAVVAAVVLFLQKGKYHVVLRCSFVTLTAFLCLPIVGKIFNGFGYISNRWSYGYAFFMALLTVFILPEMYKLVWRKKVILSIVIGAYIAVTLAVLRNYAVITGIILLVAVLLVVLFLNKLPQRWGSVLLLAVTISSIVMLLRVNYLPEYNNGIASYVQKGAVTEDMKSSVEALASKKIEDDGFYRTEVRATRSNRFVLTGGYGTNSYWSTLPAKLVDYYLDFALDSVRQNYALWGLDERAAVCTLSGVKYDLVTVNSKGASVPYGFEKIKKVKSVDKDYAIYENQYALPLGYTYTACMTQEEYKKLSPIERQQAILQCAIVDDSDIDMAFTQPELSVVEKECTIEEMTDVVEADKDVYIIEEGGTITYTFEGEADSETYLYLTNTSYTGMGSSKITVKSGKVSRTAVLYHPANLYYFEREGISFNLGYSEEGKTSCTVTFENAGTYKFTPVILCSPMQDYVRDVTALGEAVLENIEEGTDKITGTVHLDEKRLLTLSIPNYGGWKAYVNGREVELLDVNTLYMGIVLDAGDYDIELRYTMPGLKEGGTVSGIAVVGLILCVINGRIKQKRKQKKMNMKEA